MDNNKANTPTSKNTKKIKTKSKVTSIDQTKQAGVNVANTEAKSPQQDIQNENNQTAQKEQPTNLQTQVNGNIERNQQGNSDSLNNQSDTQINNVYQIKDEKKVEEQKGDESKQSISNHNNPEEDERQENKDHKETEKDQKLDNQEEKENNFQEKENEDESNLKNNQLNLQKSIINPMEDQSQENIDQDSQNEFQLTSVVSRFDNEENNQNTINHQDLKDDDYDNATKELNLSNTDGTKLSENDKLKQEIIELKGVINQKDNQINALLEEIDRIKNQNQQPSIKSGNSLSPSQQEQKNITKNDHSKSPILNPKTVVPILESFWNAPEQNEQISLMQRHSNKKMNLDAIVGPNSLWVLQSDKVDIGRRDDLGLQQQQQHQPLFQQNIQQLHSKNNSNIHDKIITEDFPEYILNKKQSSNGNHLNYNNNNGNYYNINNSHNYNNSNIKNSNMNYNSNQSNVFKGNQNNNQYQQSSPNNKTKQNSNAYQMKYQNDIVSTPTNKVSPQQQIVQNQMDYNKQQKGYINNQKGSNQRQGNNSSSPFDASHNSNPIYPANNNFNMNHRQLSGNQINNIKLAPIRKNQ